MTSSRDAIALLSNTVMMIGMDLPLFLLRLPHEEEKAAARLRIWLDKML